jgi:hypothetical protein
VTEAATQPVKATSVDPLAHSNWKGRRAYAYAVTAVLLAIMAYAVYYEKTGTLDVLAWLLSTMFVLWMVAPSAEQAVKMLATAAALRSGVAFSASAEVDEKQGTASSQSSAVPTDSNTAADGELPPDQRVQP